MSILHDPKFSHVALACQEEEPNDREIEMMIDDVIFQLYGPEGLRRLVKPGDHVVIKTNVVCCWQGKRGEKGRGVITDPRVTRYVAEKIREIIGWGNGSDLKVVDCVFSPSKNPSQFFNTVSFHWARLNRVPDNTVSPEDITYDYEGNGVLDGKSGAELVNLDGIDADGRDLHMVTLANGRTIPVAWPRFLRRKEEATDGGDYTDVFIGLPVFKNHGFMGCTGSLKLHYGMRDLRAHFGDTGRRGHSGMFSVSQNGTLTPESRELMCDYLAAQHKIRTYDLVIMDCLTANRAGPCSRNGAVSLTPDPNEAVDYILTNAIMGSTDPVAIDTVETAFGGYDAASIPMPRIAAENQIGVTNPEQILVDGLARLRYQRARVAEKYAPEGRYPLSTMGNAVPVEDYLPNYTVHMEHFTVKPDEDGLHHVKYVVQVPEGVDPKLCRIDLVVAGQVRQSLTGEDMKLEGEFTFRHSDYDNLGGAYVVGYVAAWDRMFNCVLSDWEFYIPPDGCQD